MIDSNTQNDSGRESAILLACPFCGAQANLIAEIDAPLEVPRFWHASCVRGCASGWTRGDKQAVIDRWNARHDTAELAAIRTKLAASRDALLNLSTPTGAYNRDPLKHAENVIGGVIDTATAALAIIDANPSPAAEPTVAKAVCETCECGHKLDLHNTGIEGRISNCRSFYCDCKSRRPIAAADHATDESK